MKTDISVVLCVHDEGARIQATARSLACAFRYAIDNTMGIELIVLLNATDDITNRYIDETFKSIFSEFQATYANVDFDSVGTARNKGIEMAQGDVVAVVDSDDLFSENIFVAGYKAAMEDNSKVYHPEYTLGFGEQNWIRKNIDSKDDSRAISRIIDDPVWPSTVFASKDLFYKIPYRDAPVGGGTGPEAWQWNVDTLDDRVEHAIISRTVVYYRKKGSSALFDQYINKGDLLATSSIFLSKALARTVPDVRNVVEYSSASSKKNEGIIKKFLRKGRKLIKTRMGNNTLSSDSPEVANIPRWLTSDQRTQYDFEHHIYPDSGPATFLEENTIGSTPFSDVYWDVVDKLPDSAIEYLFIIPGITKGGAEQVLMNHLNLIYQEKPLSKVVLLATEDREATRLSELPKNVTFIQLEGSYCDLSYDNKIRLLATLSRQISPRVLHIIISEEGFGVVERYGKAISSQTKIYASIFGPNRRGDNRRTHILLDNTKMAQYMTRIFTDNRRTIDEFVLWTGLPRSLFAEHYQPLLRSRTSIDENRCRPSLRPLRVLWAARLDSEKRVDIYDSIAQAYKHFDPSAEFYVFGSAVGDPTKKYETLVKSSLNIIYGGSFNGGVRGIPGQYDIFVLTSDFEGLPNALIEAASLGMALVAPNVGGISEVVTDQTGILISNNEDVNQYVDAIKSLSDDKKRLGKLSKGAKSLVEKRHSWSNFVKQVKESDGDYLN